MCEKGLDFRAGLWYLIFNGRESRRGPWKLNSHWLRKGTKGKEVKITKTVTVEKHAKTWYVIIRIEGSNENRAMAGFATRKAAIACRDHWAAAWELKVV